MGIAEIITIILVALKMTGNCGWSWWAVFSLEIIAVVLYLGYFIFVEAMSRSMGRRW